MKKNIVIVVFDEEYVSTLEYNFLINADEKINLHIITDKDYFNFFFQQSQSIDCLIIDEKLYGESVKKQGIKNVFLFTEVEANINSLSNKVIYKYASIKEILNRVLGSLNISISYNADKEEKRTKIVTVMSPCGGAGKTTLSLALAYQLSKYNRKILYIDSSYIQNYMWYLDMEGHINNGIESKIRNRSKDLIKDVNECLIHMDFYCLLPFKTNRISYGIKDDDFIDFIKLIKDQNVFDYIILDTASDLSYQNINFIDISEKIVNVCIQTEYCTYRLNQYVNVLKNFDKERLIYICNKFDVNKQNYLDVDVCEYIGDLGEKCKYNSICTSGAMRDTALLLV